MLFIESGGLLLRLCNQSKWYKESTFQKCFSDYCFENIERYKSREGIDWWQTDCISLPEDPSDTGLHV
jgi:hypothetical protein